MPETRKRRFAVLPLGGSEPEIIEAASMARSTNDRLVLTNERMEIVYDAEWSMLAYCREVSPEDIVDGKIVLPDPKAGRKLTKEEADKLYHEMMLAVFSRGDVPLDWLYELRAREEAEEAALRPKVEVVDVVIPWREWMERLLALRFPARVRAGVLAALALVAFAFVDLRLVAPSLSTRAARELWLEAEGREGFDAWAKRWGALLADAKEGAPRIFLPKPEDRALVRDLRALLARSKKVGEADVRWLARWDAVLLARDEIFPDAFKDPGPGGRGS